MNNVLVLGSGGREHALAEKLKRDEVVEAVLCAPGNGGTELSGGITNVNYRDFDDLATLISERGVDLVVVGPEKPLSTGLADYLEKKGISVFGFRRKTARLEASKGFADRFKKKYGVCSPGFESFASFAEAEEYVERRLAEGVEKLWIKADELCGGKGVIGITSSDEAKEALTSLLKEKKCGMGEKVIVQDHVPGEEITVQAITDGESFALTPSSQDHKPLYEGGVGPNTGGMGAYAPAPVFDDRVQASFEEEILVPTSRGLEAEALGGPGVIYFGLGLSRTGDPEVLEYNVRFGDPEAQTVLELLDSDLYPLLRAATEGRLSEVATEVSWSNGATVCVVASVEGYPVDYGDERHPIEGIEEANNLPGVRVYHSGTTVEGGRIYTDGGRVLSLTARGDSIEEARTRAYRGVKRINFTGMYYRSDIGEGVSE